MLGRRTTTIVTHDILYNQRPFTRVKLCGMFREEDIAVVNEVCPDLCGFVINYPSSPRHVDRDTLWNLVSRLDPTIPAVGVFVDQPLGYVAELSDEVLDVVQLHGTEGNPYITFLRELVDIPIIQTIRIRGSEDVERASQSKADFVLLDCSSLADEDEARLLAQDVRRPFILSGNLGPDNVAGVISRWHPWGVDMNAGLEAGGLKDPDRMRAAVTAARGVRT